MECIYIVLTCLIVLMHNSNALCNGNLLLVIYLVAGVTWLVAWKKGGHIYCAYLRSQIRKMENNLSNQYLTQIHLFPLSLQMHTFFPDYKLLLVRKNTEGAFALPLAPLTLGATNLVTSMCLF